MALSFSSGLKDAIDQLLGKEEGCRARNLLLRHDELANLPEISFYGVAMLAQSDWIWQVLAVPPHRLIHLPSQLPVDQQPLLKVLDDVVHADIAVDVACLMQPAQRRQQARHQTLQLAVIVDGEAGTHWFQLELHKGGSCAPWQKAPLLVPQIHHIPSNLRTHQALSLDQPWEVQRRLTAAASYASRTFSAAI